MILVQDKMQDDLAGLLRATGNLSLDPATVPAQQEEPKMAYSISQHYHHSAHAAKQTLEQPQPQQRPASEPPQPEYQAAEAVLGSYGVDASALSSAQLELFKRADDPQKERLIELWRLCPPTNSINNPTLAWSSTTMEQEVQLAQMRFERMVHGEQPDAAMSLDGTPVPTPLQGGDGRWLHVEHYMEPYMSMGYEASTRREGLAEMNQPRAKDSYSHLGTSAGGPNYVPSTDPVYKTTNNGSGHDWRSQQAVDMENQYGMLMAMRDNDMEL